MEYQPGKKFKLPIRDSEVLALSALTANWKTHTISTIHGKNEYTGFRVTKNTQCTRMVYDMTNNKHIGTIDSCTDAAGALKAQTLIKEYKGHL